MKTMTPTAAYRRELSVTARPFIGGIVLAAVVIGTLVGTILYVAFSTGGSSDFKAGVTNMSLIAIIPAFAGVRLAHQNFIADHRNTVQALRILGIGRAFFTRHLLLQGACLALLASTSAVVLGRLLATPLFKVILLGLNKQLPDHWGSPIDVAWSSLLVLVPLYLLGVGILNVDKVLAKTGDRGAATVGKSKSLVGLVGLVLAVVNIAAGIWCMVTTPPGPVVLIFVFTLPFLAVTLAGTFARALARWAAAAIKKVSGWSAPALGIRSSETVGTTSRVGLATALVAIPLAGFTGAQTSLWAANYVGSQNFQTVPVVVGQDFRLLEAQEADGVCEEIGDDCRGVVYWQPSDFESAGETSVPMEKANDYSLAGSNDHVIGQLLSPAAPVKAHSPFYPDFMVPFSGISSESPVKPQWGLPVVAESASAPDHLRVESAQDWVRHVDMDSQIMYGPHGDGTAGFVPTAAYTLLAICLVLAVSVMGKRANLHAFFSPLRLLGRTQGAIQRAEFWAILFPYCVAMLTALLVGIWYTVAVHVAVSAYPGALLPYLPPGLWVLFVLVFLGTSATAFLPTPDKDERGADAP